MQVYSIGDLALGSSIPLPELTVTSPGPADCTFELNDSLRPAASGEPEPIHRWLRPDGELWLSIERDGQDYRLRYPDLAEFLVSGDGSRVQCLADARCSPGTIRHLLLDQVVPLVCNLRGDTVLHAAAICVQDKAAVFLGATGSGKSTLTTAFAMHGHSILGDDWLLIRAGNAGLNVYPSYPSLRLWDESMRTLVGKVDDVEPVAHYTEKKRVALNRLGAKMCAGPVPLGKFYFLGNNPNEHTKLLIREASPRDALLELVKNTYRIDVSDRERLRTDLDSFCASAAMVPGAFLDFPHSFADMPRVEEAILRNMRSTATRYGEEHSRATE